MSPPIRKRPSFHPYRHSLPSGSFYKPLILIPQRADRTKSSHRKLIKLITGTTALSKSVKLWAMPYRVTQNRQVVVESSDKMWSTGEENGKPLQYSCLENPMSSMKGKKTWQWKMNSPVGAQYWSVGAQYATREEQRNNSRKNEETESKWKCPAVDVTDDGSKLQCYKEKHHIGTWNVRSMNQGKLEVVKQEMVRVNINILGISKLKWTGMGEFNSDDHYIYYCGQESLKRNGVAYVWLKIPI